MNFILSLTMRSSTILLVAGLFAIVLHRASPSFRQWLWTLAFVSILLLPLLILVTPEIPIHVPFSQDTQNNTSPVTTQLPLIQRPSHTEIKMSPSNQIADQPVVPRQPIFAGSPANVQQSPTPKGSSASVQVWTLLRMLWFVGASGIMFHYLWRVRTLHRIIKHSTIGNDMQVLGRGVMSQLCITVPVRILVSDRVEAPLSTGIFRPAILLPSEALGWSKDRVEMIIQHELIHVARRDLLAQWIEVFACIVYWYNPLVWLSARFSATEREMACDARVLSLGNKKTEYAAHLIEIARTMPTRAIDNTLAFSFRSNLSRRVHYILKSTSGHQTSGLVYRYIAGVVMFLIAVLMGTATLDSTPVSAQDDPVVLSIRLPEYMRRDVIDNALRGFEEDNPGVQIVYSEKTSTDQLFSAYNGADAFDIARNYFESADVLLIGPGPLSPIYARTGWLLDLSPLIDADTTLNPSLYHDAVWQSVRWDGGMWAIPTAFDLVLFMYEAAAFDAAGLSYPDATWTLQEIENTARMLAGGEGETGLLTFGTYTGMLLSALSGQQTMDTMLNPQLSNYASILEQWSRLQNAGIVGVPPSGNVKNVPFSVASTMTQTSEQAIALLPGGTAGIQTTGFGVSSGTAHPELAYKLAKFLSTYDEDASELIAALPARKDIAPATTIPAAWQETIDAALLDPMLEPPYLDYLDLAIKGEATLDEAQLRAEQALTTAGELHDTITISVENPLPDVPESNETVIRFAAVTYVDPFPNRAVWQRLGSEFAESDPEVGAVEIRTPDDSTLEGLWQDYDCIYSTYQLLRPHETYDSFLINLDPLLDADSSIDPEDFIGGTLQQVQRENKFWAYPLVIEPYVMRYDPEAFDEAGLRSPSDGWTPSEFEGAVKQLSLMRDGRVSFGMSGNNSTSILMLAASYGGLPIDFRTDPPTFDLTDPDTVAAVQRVLDLFNEGYANYEELGIYNMSFPSGYVPIHTSTIGIFSFPPPGTGTLKTAPYPEGEYMPVAYEMGAAYITTNAPNPEACYRWISSVAEHAYLLEGIPARMSVINTPETVATKGEEEAEFYRFYGGLISQPNAVVFPPFSGNPWYEYQSFLNEVFDKYILEDADLETAMQEAQRKVDELLACDEAAQEQFTVNSEAYFQFRGNCLSDIDERWREIYSQSSEE